MPLPFLCRCAGIGAGKSCEHPAPADLCDCHELRRWYGDRGCV